MQGNVALRKTSSPKTVTLTNSQTVSLNFSSIVISANFAISSNTCGASIAAGASCTVGVTFSPPRGTVNGTLTFNDNAANSPQTVSLTGTGK
jgi:Abnormal spindle-like microcephaly-assoc'd, ASPM-SPD-2-Hydin